MQNETSNFTEQEVLETLDYLVVKRNEMGGGNARYIRFLMENGFRKPEMTDEEALQQLCRQGTTTEYVEILCEKLNMTPRELLKEIAARRERKQAAVAEAASAE
jgi:hypothetical protein